MNHREQQVRASHEILSDELLREFLRRANNQPDVFAIKLVNDQLDAKLSLDQIFYTGEDNGFSLIVERLGDNALRIEFSCHAGPMAGDGGVWHVQSNESGKIETVKQVEQWIE